MPEIITVSYPDFDTEQYYIADAVYNQTIDNYDEQLSKGWLTQAGYEYFTSDMKKLWSEVEESQDYSKFNKQYSNLITRWMRENANDLQFEDTILKLENHGVKFVHIDESLLSNSDKSEKRAVNDKLFNFDFDATIHIEIIPKIKQFSLTITHINSPYGCKTYQTFDGNIVNRKTKVFQDNWNTKK